MSTGKLFFDLIRVSIGRQVCLSHTPSADEWSILYAMAKKQSLVGICFAGVQRLQRQEQCPPEMLYLKWMGMAAKIQQRNEVVNRQCVELQSKVADAGFRSCILKGQGVARFYGSYLRGLRQSGDIDIWMDGGFERVNSWVQQVAPTRVVNQHHVELKVYKDTEVEAHYHPINIFNPRSQCILKSFFKSYERECLSMERDGMIHTPSAEFNVVFLMVHIFHHLFTEGIGLRQVMDYYFVLKSLNGSSLHGDCTEVIHGMGLDRFASALMWVMGHVFDLEQEYMLWEPNEKDGRFLLDEIMHSGNFGKQDERQKGLYDSKWNSFWMVHFKTFRFWRFDHCAWFWSPIERIKGYLWRRMHGYRQY